MPVSNKVLIGCIAVILLVGVVVACGVGGIFLLGFNSEIDQTDDEGMKFGRTTDQRGCQDEALRRLRAATKAGNIINRQMTSPFLGGCLKTSRATVDYCSNAPKIRS